MSLTDVSTQAKAYALRDSIKLYAGATLPDPGASSVVTPASSSSAKSSSSVASSSSVKSSSSVAKSSSSQGPVAGEASLTKHGSGSANQEVAQGAAVTEFYYTIAGATGATVTGLPDGVSGTLKGSDFYISGTVSATVAPGAYKFTVTTTGATTNASKSGTITVTGNGTAPASSSSAKSSSSNVVEPPEESSSSSAVEVQDESSSSEKSDAIVAVMANRMNLSGREVAIYGLGTAAGSVQVIVFDMQGRLLFRRNVTGQNNVFALPGAGSYLVRVGTENHVVKIR